MRTSWARPAIVAALALLAGAPAARAADPPATISGAWAPQWLVQLAGAPTADGASPAALDAEHTRFAAGAAAGGVRYHRRFTYTTLFNGVSVSASNAAAAKLRRLDGVAAVYPVQAIPLGERTEAFSLPPSSALAMTGAAVAQSRLGLTGRGVHVALIDSGVDYRHPDLGGCFGPGCRVTNGYDFVGDDYDEEESDPGWQPVPHPDADPDDCAGHGTHVAGVVGANGGLRGVAPDVTFAAYRVFGCNGATSDDVMLAAMERAYRDGADVLNMSIGEDRNGWPQGPVSQAAARLVRRGVVVVAAAGNDHSDGAYAIGAPAVGDGVIAVTSVDNVDTYKAAVTVSPDDHPVPYLAGTGSAPLPPAETTMALAAATPDDACAPPAPGSLAGKVALVTRGTCTFIDKGANLAAAGAVAMVLANNVPTDWVGNLIATGVPIPVIGVSQADGDLLRARLAQGPVTLTWGALAAVPSDTGGRWSGFPSEGPAADLTLKPDIAAPGGSILSTWPLRSGARYALLSGTSMAAPHVTGAAALFLQAHPGTPARDVGPALENSADPVRQADGSPEPIARQGAGLVDIDDAILATTRITPGTLSLGDDPRRARPVLTLANHGSRAVAYALSHTDAPALPGRDVLSELSLLPAPSTVTFGSPRRPLGYITVPAHGRARVPVTVTPDPALPEGALYGGDLVFTPAGDAPPLRVPYAGYLGDYSAVPVLTPTARGFPWLARETGITLDSTLHVRPVYVRQDAGAAYTLAPWTFGSRTGADTPFVLAHLNSFARRLRLDVAGARGRVLGAALVEDYVPRDAVDNVVAAAPNLFTALAFDGTVRAGGRRLRLPDGDYRLILKVQGSRGGPWESWTSPVFRIDRG